MQITTDQQRCLAKPLARHRRAPLVVMADLKSVKAEPSEASGRNMSIMDSVDKAFTEICETGHINDFLSGIWNNKKDELVQVMRDRSRWER